MKNKSSELNRRECLAATAIGAAVTSAAVKGSAQTAVKDSRPNILLIMVDQHHPGYFGYAGHPLARTPNLEKLARNGLNFTRAFCGNPLCMPSRAGVFTGLTTRGHRARMNGVTLDAGIPTCTDEFRNLCDVPQVKSLRADLKAELLDKIMETDYPLPRQTARS